MRAKLFSTVFILVFVAFGATAVHAKVSYKYLKKQLKKDSSPANIEKLVDEVLGKGVKFVYNQKRDAELRKLGATDVLIRAIYSSIVDETDEERLYKDFTKTYDNDDKKIRRKAYDTGLVYIRRFEKKSRFSKNFARVKRDMDDLICEFDPNSGC